MRNAIRSEWIKLRTARSNLVLLLLSAVVPVAFTILVTATVRSSDVEVTRTASAWCSPAPRSATS